jgi:hypothetical protein
MSFGLVTIIVHATFALLRPIFSIFLVKMKFDIEAFVLMTFVLKTFF